MLGRAIPCARKRTVEGKEAGEKESKKLIEFHRGLVYPSLPPYTHVGASYCVRRRGRVKGVSVVSRNTSTPMEEDGIRIYVCVYVCACACVF